MHPSPCSETTSPCPSVRSSTTGGYTARAHGRPEETTVQLAPRQAARDARDRGAEGERLPELRAAQAAASRLRELWDVQGPRGRAAPHRRSVRAMPRIAVDAMGGDRGPAEVVAGALEAAGDGLTPILYGSAGIDPKGLELHETHGVVEMDEKPAEAVRAKPDSSLVASVRAVAEGKADAVVSAGNTGAMLAAGLLELRRIQGVMRPAIAVPIPGRRGPSVLLDCGANADARPEHLVQFAAMGSVFAEEILDIPNPEVRLLSIGEEPEKGNQLTLEAHELLAASDLNFKGNAEGRDILAGASDVVVTDGFTGNVTLKLLEGTILTLFDALRSEITATATGKLGGLLIR